MNISQPNTAFVLLILSMAAFYDTKTGKIPNLLILAGAFPGGFLAGPSFLPRFLLGLVLLWPFFGLRFFGAGDIKLCALLIGWTGWENFLPQMFAAFAAAAAVSVILLLQGSRQLSRKLPAFRSKTCSRASGIPMAPFILFGYVLIQAKQLL